MSHVTTRRELLYLAGTPLLGAAQAPGVASIRSRLPRDVPPGVPAIILAALQREPGSLITDWFGTILMHGLLRWHARGISEVAPFARAWLDYHLENTPEKYAGPKSRIFLVGGVSISTYAGYFGLAFPCYEMAKQLGDERARRVCLDLASILLHRTARNRFGLIGHDDISEFAIPDTCYFAVHALMLGYRLDPAKGEPFLDNAVFQLRAYIDTFLIPETGLAKTILFDHGLGDTYWTRASGWLMWAITAVLRHLPPAHPAFKGFQRDLGVLAGGVARVQDPSGALRVLVDDLSTPLESTGTAMCAMGIHESIRRGWLPASHGATAEKAWKFVQTNITEDGGIRNAYARWAVPAEKRQIDGGIRTTKTGWTPGFILRAADEMTTEGNE